MNRKELVKAITLLNEEDGLLERIGHERIKTSKVAGRTVEVLQGEFKAAMLALEDAKLLDETPTETFEFYNDNADEFVPDPEAVKEEGTEEVVEKTETKSKKGGNEKVEKDTNDKEDVNQPDTQTGKSRYGHRLNSQAAKLDDLFFEGTTIEAAVESSGSNKSRVKSHINHLTKDKQLKIVENEGVYKVV